MVEEFKVAKCRVMLLLKDSRDELVRNMGITTRTGHKWAADTVVRQAEGSLRFKDIVGSPCIGWQGLGTAHFQQWGKANSEDRKKMVQAEI